MFAKKLPLNSMFKEALAKLTGNRKPVYSTPLVTWTNRKTFRREGITLRSTIKVPKLFQGWKNNKIKSPKLASQHKAGKGCQRKPKTFTTVKREKQGVYFKDEGIIFTV